MTRERAPYSRVYWSIYEDPKFDSIRIDWRRLGVWLTLLLQADMAYPAPAFLPRVPKGAVDVLVEVGLVDLLSGNMYRIRGLAAERERRSRSPLGDQLGSFRGPDAVTVIAEAVDESETSQAEAVADDIVGTYYSLTTRVPRGRALAWLNDLEGRYGATARDVLVQKWTESRDISTLLSRTHDALRLASHRAERQEREDENARNRAKRAPVEPWREEFAAALEARQPKDAA